jgi:hypothetical protein
VVGVFWPLGLPSAAGFSDGIERLRNGHAATVRPDGSPGDNRDDFALDANYRFILKLKYWSSKY